MDNQDYYVRNGDLSYEVDGEHTDAGLTNAEMGLLSGHLCGVRRAAHLCCGAGRHVAAFRRLGIFSVGIDISERLIRRGLRDQETRPGAQPSMLVVGDVKCLPLKDRTFDCVTLLGNSLCLFSKTQCPDIFAQAGRLLSLDGLFVLDLPDADCVRAGMKAPSRTSQTVPTKSFGQVEWEWIRHLNGEKGILISQETIQFRGAAPRGGTERRLRFDLSLYDPRDICSLAREHRFRPVLELCCQDPTGRYKGMLKKRVMLLFQKDA